MQSAGYAGHLEYLLPQPEMAAVMATCPRARRVLRPIARMLALRMLDPVKPKPVLPENYPVAPTIAAAAAPFDPPEKIAKI